MVEPLRFLHFEVRQDPSGGPKILGRGAMGVTYLAYDINLHVPVALKVIAPELVADPVARDRFLREARTAAALKHPNVAAVLFLGEANGEVFYAMEFVEGRTLQDEIAARGALPPLRALEMVDGAARALAAAHRVGLVHRDIKPSNIMVCERAGEPGIKLIDFGLAKLASGEFTGQTLAEASAAGFRGTPHFASPEQINGEEADIRSDLYSLGATLFAMLTGRAPFEGSLAQVLSKHIAQPPPLDALPLGAQPLRPILERLLAKDPDKRFPDPSALRTALESVRKELADADSAPSPNPAPAGREPGGGEIFAGRYRLDGQVAELGHATIARAERVGGGPPAGLIFFKAAGPSELDDLEKRCATLRGIPSSNLLAVAGLEASSNPAAIVCEWVGGPSLFDVLKRRKAFAAADAAPILSRVAEALDALESAGVDIPDVGLADIILSPPEVFEVPPADLPHLRVALLPIWPDGGNVPATDRTLAPSSGFRPTGAASTFARLAWELFGGQPVEGRVRWSPLPNLSAVGNAGLREAFETPGAFSSAQELAETLRPGAKPRKRTPPARHAAAPENREAPVSGSPPPRPPSPPVPGPPRPTSAGKHPGWLIASATLAFLTIGFLVFYFMVTEKEEEEPASPAASQTPAPTATPEPSATPSPPPHPAADTLAEADTLKRKDDFGGALLAYAQAFDIEPEPARSEMEKLAAFLRSDAYPMDEEAFGSLRPGLERAADAGVVSAIMLLAEQLRPTEPANSLERFTQAAKLGQTEAMSQAGLMLASGHGAAEPDFYAAVGWFRMGAAAGDTDSMVALAECLREGKGTPADPVQALELLRNAAAFNHPRGIFLLGILTREGIPDVLPPDKNEAFRLFTLGADMGSLESQANLGVFHANGWGTPRDPEKATALWKEGAELGNPLCALFYARALQGGFGTTADPAAAEHWFREAARAGDPDALEWCRQNGIAEP